MIIDAITRDINTKTAEDNVIFIGSPKGLTSISIAIISAIKILPNERRLLFMDSVSTLLTYNDIGSIAKFSQFLIGKMHKWGASGAIISLEKETESKIVNQLAQFCDKVIELK